MCHVSKDLTFSVVPVAAINPALLQQSNLLNLSKPSTRLSPFRKIAKSARINLNRYWGLLSQKQQQRKSGSVSSSVSSVMSLDFDFSAEEEQNRINELLEAQANAEEQNSINSQIEYDSSPEQPRRLFVRQRALMSSVSSSISSSSSCPYNTDFDTISQDSVFF
ncbi:uncharacterized protein LOC110847642 [Folsomia candida]|uniref:Uncharacterized protein n=1 Tax=Folsomia candida TaxID=158441 RepID=A0A226EK62_FOLCA|nr:uncharacterized protein LOC110847642 [Folsomia candida]OXA57849.1 hypothetical protein Fcan01_07696 [Folsomia candida]